MIKTYKQRIRIISLLGIAILVCQLFFPYIDKVKKVEAASSDFEILEIVPTSDSTSQLDGNIKVSGVNFKVTTMPMKKFVAQRDELDGKYDAIAIVKGTYTSNGVNLSQGREAAHKTTSVMNDITNLRADEIIKDFINKGQLVILHQDSIKTGTNLNNKFNAYISNLKSNVLFYSNVNNNDLNKKISNFILNNERVKRPLMHLNVLPSQTDWLMTDDSLTFQFTVDYPIDVTKRDLSARLYIDTDFNDQYDSSEIVVQQKINSSNGQLTYKLPNGYSGIRNWKFEIVDNVTNLKDYQVGRVKFKGETVKVNVLQVMPKGSNKSDLNNGNLKDVTLNKDNEYSIAIKSISMDDFNKQYYANIERDYDMVIFGFGDMYNELSILQQNSVDSLKRFAKARKSIMFTHDTIYRKNSNDNNVWITNFMDSTGQKQPETNLGFQAPLKTTQAKIVNDGLMTEYPYHLSDSIKISETHNQYYTLDLEDPTIIPWYNIIGSGRDVNDSYNHFYTYSKGNITYSGTGHTNSGFPEDEQQLFVNTMYRAFLGSNQAPIITLKSPEENDYIPLNQNIELSYYLEDYNLNDKILKTRVYVNDQLKYNNNDVPNGSAIVQSIPHDMSKSGKVTIKIEAEDEHGAISQKIFSVNIFEIDASLEVSRTLGKANPVMVEEEVPINYLIKPKDISDDNGKIEGDELILSNVTFSEKFPAGLDVLREDKQGSIDKGYTIIDTLKDIVYKRQGNKFVAEPVTFTINVKPMKNEQYVLDNAKITYKDINKPDIETEAKFNQITIVAEYPLLDLEFPDSFVLNRGEEYAFKPDLKYIPENAKVSKVEWSEASGGTILKINPDTGVANAIKEGTTTVTVKVTDIFNNIKVKTALVTVRIPLYDFTIDAEDIVLKVGETKEILLTVKPEDAKNSLELQLENPNLATITKQDFTITGKSPGFTQLIVSGINDKGEKVTKRANVTVEEILLEDFTVTPKEIYLTKNKIFTNFTVTFVPNNVTNKNLKWESLDSSIVRILEPGKIEGISTGTAKIQVTSPKSTKVETIIVHIGSPLIGITSSDITVVKGKTEQAQYQKVPADATNLKSVEFFIEEEDQYYATVDKDLGIVTGLRLGKVPMKLVATTEEGVKLPPISVFVTVVDKENPEPNDGTDKY
ncbi:DUF5057 domain-containing protein [Bacillus massiliigorillae]|uniref:DUF5057 domain-containing protein n=1 Tax=Bacillus massiliigorillae TaxID=1243664 RepID=UPI0003A24D5B|nr:DUF5057 domain-containing protein [Bacillus massiliigorillae]